MCLLSQSFVTDDKKIFKNSEQFIILLFIYGLLDIPPPSATTEKKLYCSYIHALLHIVEE